MKKQFTKIKIAAENLSRSNKPDRKDFELETIEKQVDKYRDVLDRMVRKLPAVSNTSTPTDPQEREKRIKKNAHFKIGIALEESADELNKELPLYQVLANCGDLEKAIAECTVDSELETESEVVRRLKLISDNEIQKISTLKRNVSRTLQEYTSLKRSYETAIRLEESQAKINNIKEQQEQCEVKLEKERDMWAAQMFELIAREDEIVFCVRDYVLNQRNFYERTLRKVNQSLARIQDVIQATEKTRFDTPLTEHLSSTHRQISYILELCVCCLMEYGLQEEGLLRVGCAKTKLRRMKHALEAQYVKTPLPAEYQDPHVIASILKDYLRMLPEPLLTYRYYKDFIRASEHSTEEERKSDIKTTLEKLPTENFENLRYLSKFLWHVAQNSDKNKMSSQNIAIVMSPNMLRPRIDKSSTAGDYLDQVNCSSASNVVVELLISQWDYFFSGDVDFFVTLQKDKLFAENGRHINNKNEHYDKHENDGASLDNSRYGTIRRQKAVAPSPPTKLNENNKQNTVDESSHSAKQLDGEVISNNEDIKTTLRNGEIHNTSVSVAKELFTTNGIEKPEKPPLPKVLQMQQQQQQQQQKQQQQQQQQAAEQAAKPVPMTRTQFFGLDNLPSPDGGNCGSGVITCDRSSTESNENRNSMILKPDLPQKPKIPKRPIVLNLSGANKQEGAIAGATELQNTDKISTQKLIDMLRQENCDNIASHTSNVATFPQDNQIATTTITTTTATTATTVNNQIDENNQDNNLMPKRTSLHIANLNMPTENNTEVKLTQITPVSPNVVQTPKRPTVPAPPPPTIANTNNNRKPVDQN